MTAWRSPSRPRTCPACGHLHPTGTTCRRCPECLRRVLMGAAARIFADLLPEAPAADGAMGGHNHNLGRYGACDGACGNPDCPRPYFDEAGLTRYGATALPTRPALLDIPVEIDYPASAWEVDE